MTQSGVSRAIANLEQTSGGRLFIRTGAGLVLTEQGRIYLEEISSALDQVGAATLRLATYADADESLTIATLPSLGARWLAPRLPAFIKKFPRVDLRITGQVGHFDLESSDVDGVIHYGTDVWPNCLSDKLMDEFNVPMCAPELISAGDTVNPHLLESMTLVQHIPRPTAWRDWFNARTISHPSPMAGPKFDQYAMGIEAARAGAGAVLMPPFLVMNELKSGQLVALDQAVVQSEWRYYFMYPLKKRSKPALQRFRTWLSSEARRSAKECFELVGARSA